MAKKVSRRLVVDASVARSATMSNDQTATACREFLQVVLDVCHRVVLTNEIDREWNHVALQIRSRADEVRSRFLVSWMFAMTRKGKLIRLRIGPDTDLRAKINRLGLPDQDRQAVSEDIHLIEAAIASDHIIISRDDSVERLLSGIAPSFPEFGMVVWCNPVARGSEALEWLGNRAESVRAWQLRSQR